MPFSFQFLTDITCFFFFSEEIRFHPSCELLNLILSEEYLSLLKKTNKKNKQTRILVYGICTHHQKNLVTKKTKDC